jgi:hypothetical protein
MRKGEDAGLKAPFDPHSPAYLAAVAKMGRVVRELYLIDEDWLREISVRPEVQASAMKGQEIEAQLAAEHEKRSRAARKGWSRYQQFFDEQRRWRAEQRGR